MSKDYLRAVGLGASTHRFLVGRRIWIHKISELPNLVDVGRVFDEAAENGRKQAVWNNVSQRRCSQGFRGPRAH